jgi:hypothetical protein
MFRDEVLQPSVAIGTIVAVLTRGQGRRSMKLLGAVLIVTMCSAGLAAQKETVITSKIDVAGGRTRTISGCINPVVAGKSFMLNSTADKPGPHSAYMLVKASFKQLAKYAGHLVEIRGKVTDRGGDAKLRVRTTTTTKPEEGRDEKERTSSEVPGGALGMPYLEVHSIKTIAASCP